MRTASVVKKVRQYIIWNSILVFALTGGSLYAGAKLSASSKSSLTIEIRFENSQPVAGLQFVFRSSSNVVLQGIQNSGRTSSENWMVSSNRLNDSTLSVVIVSSDLSFFPCGSGTIAEVTISKNITSTATETYSFNNVVAADPGANLVDVTSGGLTLNSQDAPTGVSSSDFSIGQNYPNPFNPSTRINYELKKDARVSLAIYDIAGREISRLVDQVQTRGTYAVTWNSSENRWGQLASGVYFARLQVGTNAVTTKMLLTK
ncbi:MAG TPA: T9SS type A sorting domain-containing protein [Bacteroidota bacterium]